MSQAYRIAGFGGLLASLFWLVQPIIVAFGAQAIYGTDEIVYDPALLRATAWFGALNAAAFLGVAAGTCLLTLALDDILDLRGSIYGRAVVFAGLVASAAWLLVAAGTATVHSTVVETAQDFSADGRAAFILGISADVYLAVVAASIASGLWLGGLAGRALERFGRPLSFMAGFAGVATILTSLYGPPWGFVLLVLTLFVLGVYLLLKSRSVALSVADGTSAHV
jgi:hypothetical protein